MSENFRNFKNSKGSASNILKSFIHYDILLIKLTNFILHNSIIFLFLPLKNITINQAIFSQRSFY